MNITAQIHKILSNPQRQWKDFVVSSRGGLRTAYRDIQVNWNVYNSKDYLFTHDSIVASVATDPDGYTIKPATEELVNANGNAWTNEVLLNCYKTFIGGENYYEHVQVPSLSKGKILDAVIREVTHNGEKIYVVDILVATNRIHQNLVRRIENGELNTMSMGATAKFVQCSVCGKIIDTLKKEPICSHLEHNLGKHVIYHGKKKYCAELCGAIDPRTKEYIPDSCTFIEASWVEQPAFEGAVTNYLIETPEIKAEREERKALEEAFSASLLSSLRVADKKGGLILRLAQEFAMEEKLNRIANRIFHSQN
mgnify:CR=1 FL=1